MRKLAGFVGYLGVAAAMVGAFSVARDAQAGDAAFLNTSNGYKEECMDEGCSREERNELYFNGDYDEECIGEGCFVEEPAEVACPFAQVYTNCSPAGRINTIRKTMENHFCSDGRTVLFMDPFTSHAGPGTDDAICN